jgi:hypothetical protein
MLRLILKLWTTNPDADWMYDYTFVDLTEWYIKRILMYVRAVAAFKKSLGRGHGEHVFKMDFWDASATAFANPEGGFDAVFGSIWSDRLEGRGWALEPETFLLHPYAEQRTEADVLCVTDSDVWWEATPKGGDTRVNTNRITVQDLEDVLKRLRGKHYGVNTTE